MIRPTSRYRPSMVQIILVLVFFDSKILYKHYKTPVISGLDGAMVARSPPKAKAVGSSPTSVAFFLPFLWTFEIWAIFLLARK
jgi:hypothetical protein